MTETRCPCSIDFCLHLSYFAEVIFSLTKDHPRRACRGVGARAVPRAISHIAPGRLWASAAGKPGRPCGAHWTGTGRGGQHPLSGLNVAAASKEAWPEAGRRCSDAPRKTPWWNADRRSACRCTRCRAKSADGSSPRLLAFRFLFWRSESAGRNEGTTPSFQIAPPPSRFTP